MNPHDPVNRTGADIQGINASTTPGTQADVTIRDTGNTTKVTVSAKDGTVAKGWASNSALPKDADEWRRWVRSAIPWVAGAAIVLAAATSMKRAKEDGTTAGRKVRRAGDKAGSAIDDLGNTVERNWFGLKKNVEGAADEAGNKLDNAKNAAARKADETRGVVREKAHEAKEGVKDAGRWVGNKAHDAADTAGRAAHKVEDKVAAAGSAALATASSAEEKAGHFLKKGGEGLEKDGKSSKQYYRGQQVKEETKSKWGCSIM